MIGRDHGVTGAASRSGTLGLRSAQLRSNPKADEMRAPARSDQLAMTEPLAILPRAHVEMALERGAHPLLVAKARSLRHRLDPLVRLLEQAARGLQAEQLDRFRRRAPHPGFVGTGEVAKAHAGRLRHSLHGELGIA